MHRRWVIGARLSLVEICYGHEACITEKAVQQPRLMLKSHLSDWARSLRSSQRNAGTVSFGVDAGRSSTFRNDSLAVLCTSSQVSVLMLLMLTAGFPLFLLLQCVKKSLELLLCFSRAQAPASGEEPLFCHPCQVQPRQREACRHQNAFHSACHLAIACFTNMPATEELLH